MNWVNMILIFVRINQGSDEINIVVGVENKDFEKTIRVMYERFIG